MATYWQSGQLLRVFPAPFLAPDWPRTAAGGFVRTPCTGQVHSLPCVHVSMCAPSPTLSPTDPVPRPTDPVGQSWSRDQLWRGRAREGERKRERERERETHWKQSRGHHRHGRGRCCSRSACQAHRASPSAAIVTACQCCPPPSTSAVCPPPPPPPPLSGTFLSGLRQTPIN